MIETEMVGRLVFGSSVLHRRSLDRSYMSVMTGAVGAEEIGIVEGAVGGVLWDKIGCHWGLNCVYN